MNRLQEKVADLADGRVIAIVDNMTSHKRVTVRENTGTDGVANGSCIVWLDLFQSDYPVRWPDVDCVTTALGKWLGE